MQLPWRALSELLGDLRPGLYAIAGPVGSGKTQLALQIAVHAAEETAVGLWLPRLAASEVCARVEGIGTRTHWAELDAPSLPARMEITEEARPLMVIDPFVSDLDRVRRVALDHASTVLMVLEPLDTQSVKGFVPQDVLRRAPAEIATWIGVSPAIAAEVDALLVLAPDRPRTGHGWMTIEVLVAKHRRGIPGRAPLIFNGSWFEDEPEDLDLGL